METPVAAAAPPPPESKFVKALKKLLTTTTWLVMGIVLIFLAVIFHLKHLVPAALDPLVNLLTPRLPYFLMGLGLICLGQVRQFVVNEYTAESKKDKKSPHAWKIPLIAAQVWILWIAGLYCLIVGIGKMPPLKSHTGMITLLIIFLGYVLWYVTEHFKNHFPSLAALRIAMISVILAALAFFFWWMLQMIFFSLIFGFFALVAALMSLTTKSSLAKEQRAYWLRYGCVAATVILLFFVGSNASSYGTHHVELVGLNLAAKDPNGTVGAIAYSQDNRKIAFALQAKDGWYLQVVSDGDETFKVAAGEDVFRPIFIEGGKFLAIDAVKGGERGLWKVDAGTGAVQILRRSGVMPFTDGTPWSEKTGKLLYVTQEGEQYQLRAYPAEKGKKKPLVSSGRPILTPSWTMTGQKIAYTDGMSGLFNVLDVKTGKAEPLQSYEERNENQKWSEFPIQEVIPDPDNFRYLYLVKTEKGSSLWSILNDGSKRKKIYDANGALRDIAWLGDGKKVIFEEKKKGFGFLTEFQNIRVLDLSMGTVEDLIPPQISHRAPAVSPNGVKVAFVSDQGLWYHTGNQGIWVALLR